jgi:hypothetical protein
VSNDHANLGKLDRPAYRVDIWCATKLFLGIKGRLNDVSLDPEVQQQIGTDVRARLIFCACWCPTVLRTWMQAA